MKKAKSIVLFVLALSVAAIVFLITMVYGFMTSDLRVDDNFSNFLTTHIAPYNRRDLPVSFVGSIAWAYQRELRQAAASLGFTIGTVFQSPMQGIISYHSK